MVTNQEKTAEELEADMAERNAGALRITAAEARFILAGRVYARASRVWRAAYEQWSETATWVERTSPTSAIPADLQAMVRAVGEAEVAMQDAARAMVKP